MVTICHIHFSLQFQGSYCRWPFRRCCSESVAPSRSVFVHSHVQSQSEEPAHCKSGANFKLKIKNLPSATLVISHLLGSYNHSFAAVKKSTAFQMQIQSMCSTPPLTCILFLSAVFRGFSWTTGLPSSSWGTHCGHSSLGHTHLVTFLLQPRTWCSNHTLEAALEKANCAPADGLVGLILALSSLCFRVPIHFYFVQSQTFPPIYSGNPEDKNPSHSNPMLHQPATQ